MRIAPITLKEDPKQRDSVKMEQGWRRDSGFK